MKRIFLMTALLLFAVSAVQAQDNGQSAKEAKIAAKAAKKAARDAERDARDAMVKTEEMQQFLAAKKAIIAHNFVVEGSQLQIRSAAPIFVNPNTNFLQLQGKTATVQIASNMGGGPNGLGGITVQGLISNENYQVANNGNVNYSFMVQGVDISAGISIILMHGSYVANVTIQPNFNSDRMTLIGNLLPTSQSTIIQGASRY